MVGSTSLGVGNLIREWRQRRRMSQLELACEAQISTRHLSFVETGRSSPSREMVLHLAERLEVPLRERNSLLVSAGYAPAYQDRPIEHPSRQPFRKAMELLLTAHEPFPALAIDRHWTLVAGNKALSRVLVGVSPALLEPPVNVVRLSLHPDGLAPRIANLPEWRAHVLHRVGHQVEVTGDPVLVDLLRELTAYPVPSGPKHVAPSHDEYAGVVVPLHIASDAGLLSFFSTTTVFGTPVDVTLSELALESFFPANAETAAILRQVAESE